MGEEEIMNAKWGSIVLFVVFGLVGTATAAPLVGNDENERFAVEQTELAVGFSPLVDSVIQVIQNENYGLARNRFSIFARHMRAQSHQEVNVYLERSQEIKVLADGSPTVPGLDVDLAVFNDRNEKIREDVLNNREASVAFTVQRDGVYRIRLLRADRRGDQEAFCGLAILTRDGHRADQSQMQTTLAKSLLGNLPVKVIVGGNLRYVRPEDGWSLAAGIVTNQGCAKFWLPKIPAKAGFLPATTVATVFGCAQGVDLDVEVFDADKQSQAADKGPAEWAGTQFVAQTNQPYGIYVTAPRTNGPCLVMTSIFSK
jgi:hypothetical protein